MKLLIGGRYTFSRFRRSFAASRGVRTSNFTCSRVASSSAEGSHAKPTARPTESPNVPLSTTAALARPRLTARSYFLAPALIVRL